MEAVKGSLLDGRFEGGGGGDLGLGDLEVEEGRGGGESSLVVSGAVS